MSRNQRIGLLAAAALVAVVAIVVAVASGGSDNNGSSSTTSTTSTTTQAGGTATTTTTTTTAAPQPDEFKLQIKGGEPVGGVQDFKVKKGDQVTIVVTADAPDDIHIHGVDIEKSVEPGKPTTFKFTADIEGIFDIESHVAEHQGREPQMAKLTVEPS